MSDGETNPEILAMEREMQQLKEEENRLKRATQKDTLRRRLEAQRQKFQNLRGRTLVHNSDKSDDKKSAKSNQVKGQGFRRPVRFPLSMKLTWKQLSS